MAHKAGFTSSDYFRLSVAESLPTRWRMILPILNLPPSPVPDILSRMPPRQSGARRRRSTFAEIVTVIRSCPRGQERNLYPYVRDIYVNILGYRPVDLLVDTADQIGGIPDLCVLGPSGIPDSPPIRWLVVEVKDEPGVFLNEASRAAIFRDKAKYIGLDTAWFVMIDPECFVLRPVTSRSAQYDASRDVILRWDGLTEEAFRSACCEIQAENAATNPRLDAFRAGDETHIAEVKLSNRPEAAIALDEASLAESRAEFYQALRSAAGLLKLASERALETLAARAREIRRLRDGFEAEFGMQEFHLDPFRLVGLNLPTRDAVKRHRAAVADFRRAVRDDPAAARLGCFTLAEYETRAKGDTPDEKSRNAVALLASETASLLIARCLMLRFFEDHGFFGPNRFLSNGGVAAFQTWRKKYKKSYAWFLRESYGEAAHLAAALFEEGNLDWVLTCADPHLSIAIERALFYLSRFDFATVEQDVLSGVYGQFLDNSQRKEYGEHYTPPEVARFIVRHLDLRPGERLLDPACGLGTFLIEAWKAMIGDAANRGAATWAEALATLAAIRGNDINAFSATIAQLQVLWHLFPFREHLQAHGFPEPTVTGGYDSLHAPQVAAGLFAGEMTEFALVDTYGYDAVVGNPPYVRPERQTAPLDPAAVLYFDEEFSARTNLCNLFIFKALDFWLRANGDEERSPGRLGFVLPIAICDNDDSSALRKFFRPQNGRWTVREIVDLELISPQLFGADVVCVILLAERGAPRADETVRLRVADERCAVFTEGAEVHVRFNLDAAPVVEMPYRDLFSPDGRWLTRLTPERKRILDRFKGQTFSDIALPYWVGKSRSGRIERWALEQPEASADDLRWERETMIRMGAAFRGSRFAAETGGLPVFKGEHIAACAIEGQPVETNIDVSRMDDSSVWRFMDILPAKGFAFHQIAPALYCAPFDPRNLVLLNTTSLFFPEDRLADFPFDLLVLSRIYQYVWALAHREGLLFRARAHIYPTTVRRLPWTDRLLGFADAFRELRGRFLAACQQLNQTELVLRDRLVTFGATTVRQRLRANADLRVDWCPALQGNESSEVGVPETIAHEGEWIVQPGDEVDKWAAFNDRALAAAFAEGLVLHPGENLRLAALLDLPIPPPEGLARWREAAAQITGEGGASAVEKVLDAVDAYVADAYGLPRLDLETIWREFETDPMLRRVQPNLPFARRRRLGLRTGLTESDRFTRAYRTRSQMW